MDFFGRIVSNQPEDAEAGGFSEPDTISTLDEPVWQTILRDLADIGLKTLHVVFPFWGSFKRVNRLKDWDLWGPLLLSFILASVLTLAADKQSTLIFTTVFVVVWLGSCIITVNAILLGGKISFFQTVCALGYSLGPLDIAALICIWWPNLIFRLIVVSICWGWSVFASWGFVLAMMPTDKTGRGPLVLYPIFLFYLVIAWMIVVVHDVTD